MDVEETRHNQALWAAYDDTELREIEGLILASIAPQEMSQWLRWMIPALSPSERAQMITGMPDAVRAPVLATARSLLDDSAWAKLCRALGPAPLGQTAERSTTTSLICSTGCMSV
jgi:hypothetical protein